MSSTAWQVWVLRDKKVNNTNMAGDILLRVHEEAFTKVIFFPFAPVKIAVLTPFYGLLFLFQVLC
jgi:hypothetical protein